MTTQTHGGKPQSLDEKVPMFIRSNG